MEGHRRLRSVLVALALAATLLLAGPAAAATHDGTAPGPVTVMTRNLDPGFSEVGVLASPDLESLLAAVEAAWNSIQESDPAGRMSAIAGEIAAGKPDLVGVQEAPVYHVYHPDGSVEIVDFLDLLVTSLRRRGSPYRLVVTQPNIDVILPSANGDFVQYTDRDAVLVRPGVPVVDTASANFDTHFDFPVGDPEDPIDVISVVRGWVSATVEMRGREWRFVSTHLEDLDPDVQAGQAAELVAEGGPAAGPGTILVGDINSDAAAGGATYESLIAAGFSDAWSETNPDPGYTWGFDPLDDPSATLTERFDVVLYRDVFSASSARLVGDQTSDMTASGLWPSDHAGVVAILNPAFP